MAQDTPGRASPAPAGPDSSPRDREAPAGPESPEPVPGRSHHPSPFLNKTRTGQEAPTHHPSLESQLVRYRRRGSNSRATGLRRGGLRAADDPDLSATMPGLAVAASALTVPKPIRMSTAVGKPANRQDNSCMVGRSFRSDGVLLTTDIGHRQRSLQSARPSMRSDAWLSLDPPISRWAWAMRRG